MLLSAIALVLVTNESRADDLVTVRLRSSIPASLEVRALDDQNLWDAMCSEGETTKVPPGSELRVRLADGTILPAPAVHAQSAGIDIDVVAPSNAKKEAQSTVRSIGIGVATIGGTVSMASLVGWFFARVGYNLGRIGEESCSFDKATQEQQDSCAASRRERDRAHDEVERNWLTAALIGGLVGAGGVTIVLGSAPIAPPPRLDVKSMRDPPTATRAARETKLPVPRSAGFPLLTVHF